MAPILAVLQNQAPAPTPTGGLAGMLPLFAIMFLIMYFMIIRPQRRKERERMEMLSRIRKNDKVLTTGGIYGTVMNLKDDDVTLRIDDSNNVRVRITRSSIVGVVGDKETGEDSKE